MSEKNIVNHTKRRNYFKLFLLPALIVLMIPAFLIYHYLTSPERIRKLAESYIQQATHMNVVIDSAEFSLFNGIRLNDVKVGQADERLSQSTTGISDVRGKPIFACRQLHLHHSPWAILMGQLRITSAVAIQPTCMIIHDEDAGTTNIAQLFLNVGQETGNTSIRLPMIELQNASIEVYTIQSDQTRKIEHLKLTIRSRPAKHDVNIYNIFWSDPDNQNVGGHSQINLSNGMLRNIKGGLPLMSIEAVMLAVNAKYDGVGAWSRLLGLTGKVRASQYHLMITNPQANSRWITLELSNASLSIPIDRYEQTLPREKRYIRFEGVNGSATVKADSIDAQFTGTFHGSRCQVVTSIRSAANQLTTLDDIDLTANFTIRKMSLPKINDPSTPQQTRFVYRWPQLARYYQIFNPQGTVDVEIEVEKKSGPEETVAIHFARLTAHDVSGTYRSFPYHASQVAGIVEFTPEGIDLQGFSGKHQHGEFTIHGRIDRSNENSSANLKITATNVSIDDSLYTILPAKYRSIMDQFSPRGFFDIEAELSRSPSATEHPTKWQLQSMVSFQDISLLYDKFPYPFEHASGHVIMDPHQIQVTNVVAHHGDGVVQVDGIIDLSAGRVQNMGLTIRGKNIEIDEPLLSAMSEPFRKSVEVFRPAGRFDVVSTIVQDEDHQDSQRIYRFTLKDVEINHQRLPIPITSLHGELTMTPDYFEVHHLDGLYRQSPVSIEGILTRNKSTRKKSTLLTDLTIEGKDISVDDELFNALPELWRSQFSQWKIKGIADSRFHLKTRKDDPDRSLIISSTVQLKNTSIVRTDPPLELQHVSATLIYHDHTLHSTNVEAQFQETMFAGKFDVQFTEAGRKGSVSITGDGIQLDDQLRSVLPKRVHPMWDQLAATGTMDIRIDDLHFDCTIPDQPTTWTISGETQLHDVSLGLSDAYQKITGLVSGHGTLIDIKKGSMLTGSINMDRITLLDHQLDQIEGDWSLTHTQDGHGQFLLENLKGKMYGGSITSKLEILFDPTQASYDFSSIVQNMDIRPYIKAARASPAYDDITPDIKGWADAHLYLTGVIGDTASRRGGGRVEVKDGYFCRLPIILSILHVLHLSIPEQDAFEEAMASFYIMGRNVQLDDIRLRNHYLTLVGDGTMTLPDRGIDLNLVYVNDNKITRLPIISDFLDGASSKMMSLHVTGPLHSPVVRAMPFRELTEEISQLFKKKKPKKIQRGQQ